MLERDLNCSGDSESGLAADEESREAWLAAGLPWSRVVGVRGLVENFWEMGSVGPAGPTTELHYSPDGDLTSAVELGNLVFIDRQRLTPGGPLRPLPTCTMDVGFGLERMATFLQVRRSLVAYE